MSLLCVLTFKVLVIVADEARREQLHLRQLHHSMQNVADESAAGAAIALRSLELLLLSLPTWIPAQISLRGHYLETESSTVREFHRGRCSCLFSFSHRLLLLRCSVPVATGS